MPAKVYSGQMHRIDFLPTEYRNSYWWWQHRQTDTHTYKTKAELSVLPFAPLGECHKTCLCYISPQIKRKRQFIKGIILCINKQETYFTLWHPNFHYCNVSRHFNFEFCCKTHYSQWLLSLLLSRMFYCNTMLLIKISRKYYQNV